MKLLSLSIFTLAAVVALVAVLLVTHRHHAHRCVTSFGTSCSQNPYR